MGGKIKNHELALEFLTDERYEKNLLYCISYELFYMYENGWYRQLSTAKFSEIVWNFIREAHPELNITTSLVSDIVGQCKYGCLRKTEDINSPYISLTDKLYDSETFTFHDFDRNKIATHKLDMPMASLTEDCLKWKSFLQSILVDARGNPDAELIFLMQEIFGYYLLNDLKAQKVFFFVGRGANGKSVLLRILEEMIGLPFISASSIQTLTTNQFAVSGLIGKKVNICNEEESKFLRSDRFKALISGDLIDAERKHESRFSFKPMTKYLFASNQLPTFDGINYGIKRRICIVPFNRVFQDAEQNKNLVNELLQELPGILGWAIAGQQRFVKNNYVFSKAMAVMESFTDFENAVSTAILFFRENFKIDLDELEQNFIPVQEFYREYTLWCNTNGYRMMSARSFANDITYLLNRTSIIQYHGGSIKRGRYLIRTNGINDTEAIDAEFKYAEKTLKKM